nr:ribonuclease H-like domain-containing protein [Tanacetum cinerariifolium]
MSYLFDFEELNGGYVAFGGNPKGATKDETTLVLTTFIIGLENLLSLKAEAVNTACYVQNRVLVTKPHNKTPYELLHGRLPSIGFMRPFGCPVTILNTLDPLGKFQGKVDEGFLVGYSTMNYHPVIAENQTNSHAGFQDIEKAGEEGTHTYMLFPVLFDGSTNSQNNNKDSLVDGKEHDDDIQKSVSPNIHSSSRGAQTRKQEFEECTNNSSNGVNAASSSVSTVGHNFINSTNDFSTASPSNVVMPNLEDLTHSNDVDDVGAEADVNNLESIISVSPVPTTRIYKNHPTSQIIGDLSSTTQTKKEPKRVHQALKDPSWIEAMQEELLQFKMQKVWILVDLPYGKRAIGLQVKQKKDGMFISQDKYVAKILKKFGLSEGKLVSTPIDAEKLLLKDSDGEDV